MRPPRLLPRDSPEGWTPYVYLVYLGFLFMYPVLGRASARFWWVTLGATAVFLPLYFRAWWVRGRELLAVCWAIALLGLVVMPWNSGASAFVIYACCFLAEVGPPAVALRWILVLQALVVAETLLVPLPPYAWLPAVAFGLLLGGASIHFAERRRANLRLGLAHAEIERLARTAERERIGRDLHDVLGHTLSLVVLKSELAAKLAERDPARAAAEIRDVERVARATLAELRGAVTGYQRRSVADELAVARGTLTTAGVEAQVEMTPPDLAASLAPPSDAALALALREAVTNVVRHAGATHCRIRLRREGEEVRLEVTDDGVGGETPDGTGLAGMRQRIAALAGRVERDGRGGTTLRIALPSPSGGAPG